MIGGLRPLPDKDAPITLVVLPEFVARHWWDRLLYNQSATRLTSALFGRAHTVSADAPYRRGHGPVRPAQEIGV